MNDLGKEKDWGFWAFTPLLLFMVLYLGSGITLTIMGVNRAFYKTPAVSILLVCLVVALFMGKQKTDTKMDIFSKAVGDPGVILTLLIFILAGAFTGVAMAMGAVDATVNLGLSIIPAQFLLPGIFIISCFIATSMGTSMGTVAAMTPIAVGLATSAGLSVPLAASGVVAGALFGDNLSIVSDTTIAATRGVGCNMRDKFRMNFLIVLPAALATIAIYAVMGAGAVVPAAKPFELIKVLPYLLVFVGGIAGFNVVIVLIAGIAAAGLIGIFTGAMTVLTMAGGVSDGMVKMASVVFIAFLVRGIMGLIAEYGGVRWLMDRLTRNVSSMKGAQYSMSALSGLLTAALANTTVAIIIAAPLAKEIGTKYNVEPRRSASLLDIFATSVAGFLPYGGQILVAGQFAEVAPPQLILCSFYSLFVLISALLTIHFTLFKRLKITQTENEME